MQTYVTHFETLIFLKINPSNECEILWFRKHVLEFLLMLALQYSYDPNGLTHKRKVSSSTVSLEVAYFIITFMVIFLYQLEKHPF